MDRASNQNDNQQDAQQFASRMLSEEARDAQQMRYGRERSPHSMRSLLHEAVNRASEIAQANRNVAGITTDLLTNAHRRFDTNSDGFVTYQELAESPTKPGSGFMRQNFTLLSGLSPHDSSRTIGGITYSDVRTWTMLSDQNAIDADVRSMGRMGAVSGVLIGASAGVVGAGVVGFGIAMAATSGERMLIGKAANVLARGLGPNALLWGSLIGTAAVGGYLGYRWCTDATQEHYDRIRLEAKPWLNSHK